MRRSVWIAGIALAAGGCGTVPQAAQPWRTVQQAYGPPGSEGYGQPGQPPSGQQQQSPFGELAKAHPELRPQIQGLEGRLSRLSELQNRALAAAMWNDVKDRTLDQMRVLNKTWREQPGLLLANWDRMLDQVEGKAEQALQQLAAMLPPDMAQQPQEGLAGQPPGGL